LRVRFDDVAATVRPLLSTIAEAPGGVGLIHADLHLENALFHGPEIRLIDFDDCGFGPRAYELAVALWELRQPDDYGALREALFDGYDLPVPAGIEHLDDLIAAREVAFALWFIGTAQVNPSFQAHLDETLAGSARHLDRLRGPV
jgi:Ser/Thr protein kinase RdoA (MazF antagonist)